MRFLTEGSYEGVKALCHAAAGLLLLAFALYSGAAWWQRFTIARDVGLEDPSLTHLAVGFVGYLALVLIEWGIVLQHLQSR
jgi:hypothetical protein